MVSATDASANKLIKVVSEKLKQDEVMRPPKWVPFVKTGAHVQKQPQDKDWWFARCASILRRTEIEGTVGVGRLRTWYGGRKARGSRPEHHVDASGNVIRKAIQTLEKSGYLKKEGAGRVLTPKGKSLLHKSALEAKKMDVKKSERRGTGSKAKEVPAASGETAAANASAGAAVSEKAVAKPASGAKGEGKAVKSKASKS